MRFGLALLLGGLAVATLHLAHGENGSMTLPKTIQAGAAFSIPTAGSGKATLYIVGPGQVVKRDVNLGETAAFPSGSLSNAGHYVAILEDGSSMEHASFGVTPASQPAHLTFLAKPSRLPVSLHNGISGAVYVFDAYHNLITAPATVSFQLSPASGTPQEHKSKTVDGVAWTQMDSTAKEGRDKFVAQVDGVSSKRVVEQVPGDPCGLRMSARPAGQQLQVQTDPVRDCSGNAVPDGTIVTFTEHHDGTESTVDVPLKKGIAEVKMPAHDGATISVASGVVMGNEIHWGK